jgi:hypothetical protein
MICKRCDSSGCSSEISEEAPAEIECPICDGIGCYHCEDGHFKLKQCGRKYVDPYIVRAINMANNAERGFLPVAGGILDQSAWFVSLWSTLACEQSAINEERLKD